MYFKDISKMRYRTPRSLNDAFGPYAKLHIPHRKSRTAAIGWMLFYGIAVGVFLYLIVFIKVGI